MKTAAILSLLLATACVSGTIANNGKDIEAITGDDDAQSTDDFEVAIEQVATPMAMPAATPGPIDVKYAITVENRTKVPVHLSRIDLQTVGGEQAQIDVMTRKFDKTIDPGAKTTVDYWATVHVNNANIGASAPMIVRTRLHLDGRLESFTRRVNGRLAVGLS